MENTKFLLMILDGWGIGNRTKSDVIFNAGTPNIDALKAKYPNSQLLTSGENVGLPDGQMGNSEVGHTNIGAGRVVYQDLVRINIDIRNNTISNNPEIIKAFQYAKDNNKNVHFIGLVSDGGVHSMDSHLYKLCDITKEYGLQNVFIHALTDGRDTDPHSGLGFVQKLENHLKASNGKIASLVGRYYTMDRDKRWERIKFGYDLLINGIGEPTLDIVKSIQKSYEAGVTDEFIKPIVKVDNCGNPIGKIKAGDVFFCFNFRTDRLREITIALSQKDMPEFEMKTFPLYYVTMARYDDTFKNVKVVYDKDNVEMTIGEVLAKNGKKQIRIAETEKYAHVTFFFSGGREKEFENEKRLLVQSPKVATYDLKPEMSAYEVRDAIIPEIKKGEIDFICLNFANGDMVGHTGIYEAITKAVKTVDQCVGEIIKTAVENGYQAMIIADHGNADYAVNDDGTPNTAHSLNPVPCILISDKYKKIENGILADVAPTILKIMGLEIPEKMTGKILVS
ncbi:MAG: phosphoglycerate mutase (2,3-diphosphoglycerate-independent) [Bacteroidetes bacterium GWA2_30_7]|nr:MAG: phosphoglycerate mutase (2,3-diphosphoglycerate-independent) [Bacteroidetes bacterium GWA2_30_7]